MLVVSYVMLAIENRAEEERPWAIIMKEAPQNPICEYLKAPAIRRPMCPTEEYAIRDFRSVCRRHMREVVIAPHRAMLMIRDVMVDLLGGKKRIMRSMPYPPNFRRIAARIIEPAIGASTWALGSHRCVRNRGSLTINAMFVKSHQRSMMLDGE